MSDLFTEHECVWCQWDLNGVHKAKMEAERRAALRAELNDAVEELVTATEALAHRLDGEK